MDREAVRLHSLSKTSLPLTAAALLMLGRAVDLVRLIDSRDLASLSGLRPTRGRTTSLTRVRSVEDERIIIADGAAGGLFGLDFRLLVGHNLLHSNRRSEARKIPQDPIRVHGFSYVTGLTNSQRNRSGKKYHI